MIKGELKLPFFLLDFYYISLYIIGMKEIIWAMIAICYIVCSVDIIYWLADKIQDKFK